MGTKLGFQLSPMAVFFIPSNALTSIHHCRVLTETRGSSGVPINHSTALRSGPLFLLPVRKATFVLTTIEKLKYYEVKYFSSVTQQDNRFQNTSVFHCSTFSN